MLGAGLLTQNHTAGRRLACCSAVLRSKLGPNCLIARPLCLPSQPSCSTNPPALPPLPPLADQCVHPLDSRNAAARPAAGGGAAAMRDRQPVPTVLFIFPHPFPNLAVLNVRHSQPLCCFVALWHAIPAPQLCMLCLTVLCCCLFAGPPCNSDATGQHSPHRQRARVRLQFGERGAGCSSQCEV